MSGYPSGGRALTLDDVFALEASEDVQISPDGSLVAFVICREYTEGEHKQLASSIWLAPTDGSASARQFTAGRMLISGRAGVPMGRSWPSSRIGPRTASCRSTRSRWTVERRGA
jgi:hypothetical protein